MKDLNKLLQLFDDIRELPISEETIGAYMEGNLSGAELRDVQNLLNSDNNLFDFVDVINDNIDIPLDNITLQEWNSEDISMLSPNEDSLISANLDNNFDPIYVLGNSESVFDIDSGITDTEEGNYVYPLEDNHKDDINDDFHQSHNDLYNSLRH